jgi:hypothetical protein
MDMARQRRTEAHELTALARELLAVSDVLTGGAGLSQTFHPESVNLNTPAQAKDLLPLKDNGDADLPQVDETFYLHVNINQSALIAQAATKAAQGKVVMLSYPDGKKLILDQHNFDKIAIPHASGV